MSAADPRARLWTGRGTLWMTEAGYRLIHPDFKSPRADGSPSCLHYVTKVGTCSVAVGILDPHVLALLIRLDAGEVVTFTEAEADEMFPALDAAFDMEYDTRFDVRAEPADRVYSVHLHPCYFRRKAS